MTWDEIFRLLRHMEREGWEVSEWKADDRETSRRWQMEFRSKDYGVSWAPYKFGQYRPPPPEVRP